MGVEKKSELQDRSTGAGSGTLWGIAPLLILLTGVFTTYQRIANGARSISGKPIHYPLSIPFVK